MACEPEARFVHGARRECDKVDSMRLAAKKTWSQQELAVKLHMGEPDKQGLLSWERRRLLIHAAKTALAAALCWWLAMRFGLHDGYWGAISAIIVLQSNFGSTDYRLARSHSGHGDWRVVGVCIFVCGRASVELHCCAVFAAIVICGLAGIPQQFTAGGRDHHHRHAGAGQLAQGGRLDARGRGRLGNRRGSGREHAGVS